jgi:hypothetical protein
MMNKLLLDHRKESIRPPQADSDRPTIAREIVCLGHDSGMVTERAYRAVRVAHPLLHRIARDRQRGDLDHDRGNDRDLRRKLLQCSLLRCGTGTAQQEPKKGLM